VPLEGAVVVEVGTGWVPLPTLLLYLCGTRRIVTYDIARHARYSETRELLELIRQDLDVCSEVLGVPRELVDQRLARVEPASNLDQLFARANIEYIAPGDASKTGLSDGSADVYYSWSVIEYMPLPVVHAVFREARRILKPTGRFFAMVGCEDEYSWFDKRLPSQHNLKYSDEQWKRIAMNDVRYINRLRDPEFMEIAEQHGAKVEDIQRDLRPEDIEQVNNMKLAERFARFAPEQNAVRRMEFILSFR
jgi:SAM-dependent methyltransferase